MAIEPKRSHTSSFGFVAVRFSMLCALFVFAGHIHATNTQLAFVEYYDPDESAAVEIAALISSGKGHDQATSLWRIRLDLGVIDPQSDWIPFGPNGLTNRLESGQLAGLRIEHMLSPRFGGEIGAFRARNLSAPAGMSGFGGAELSGFSPFSVGLNLHLTPERPLDLYFGLQLVNVDHGNLKMTIRENGITNTIPISAGLGWGVSAGVDVPIGDRGWIIQAGLRYLRFRFDYESIPPRRQTFKAYILQMGFGYRF